MSLALDVCDYIHSCIPTLVVDTNLFDGSEPNDSPDSCVTVIESPGGSDNWSGLETRPFQIIAKDVAYEQAHDLIYSVYDILKNKPGFSTIISNVFYCEVLSAPYPLDRDERDRYVFTSNFIVRKVTV